MFWDLGFTQVYYAHEHQDCTSNGCPYFDLVWHAGLNLQTEEECPDECDGGGKYRCLATEEPQLKDPDSPRSPDYDIYHDTDRLKPNPSADFALSPKGEMKGVFIHPETGEQLYAKVFFMEAKYKSITTNVAFGVEITKIPDSEVEFRKRAVHHKNRKYMYDIELEPLGRDCVILATH